MRLLGPVEFVTPGGIPLVLRQPLVRGLAVRLALARGSAVADDTVSRDLWGDDQTDRPAARLRVLASRLRGALGSCGGALVRTPAGLRLDAAPADLIAAETALAEIARRRSAARPAGQQEPGALSAEVFDLAAGALGLWRDKPLSDLGGMPFVPAQVRQLDLVQLELVRAWAEAGLALGRPIGPELERIAADHPLHEHLAGLSARALAQAGRPAEALDRLGRLRRRLAEELGIDPSPATVKLEAELRNHQAGRDVLGRGRTGSVVRSTRERRSGLMPGWTDDDSSFSWPSATKSFVGRAGELAELLRRTDEPGLVTILGGPGVGKTALAQEVLSRVQRTGRAVAWIDLAPLRSSDDLVAMLAAAAGVERAADPLARAAEALAGGLLVIDNAEHLVKAASTLVQRIRSEAEDLAILVTSQHVLRLPGEQVYRLKPLPAATALELFCARSGTEASPEARAVCEAVDRLPLAIELAAGLTRFLSVGQLADRIDNRLRLLVRGLRDAGPRHTSLRAAVDWSHDLLDEKVRTVFRRVTVFAGGWTLDAAEQVVAGQDVEPGEVAELLADLVDRSLVTLDEDGRFGLLETLRDYGLERLRASGEEHAVRRRQVEWCVRLAASGAPFTTSNRRFSQSEPELTARIRTEEPNLSQAVDWCLAAGQDPAAVGRIVGPLTWHWYYRSLTGRAIAWLRAALTRLPDDAKEDRAEVLSALAVFTRNSGSYLAALELAEAALDLYRSIGDDLQTAVMEHAIALIHLALDQPQGALDHVVEAERLARAMDAGVLVVAALNCRGLAVRQLGQDALAAELFAEVYRLAVDQEDARGIALAHSNLAFLAVRDGALDTARDHALRSLRFAQSINYGASIADALEILGIAAAADGDPAEAIRLLTVAGRHRRDTVSAHYIADELAAIETAQRTASAALGSAETTRIAEAAGQLPIELVVQEVLATAP